MRPAADVQEPDREQEEAQGSRTHARATIAGSEVPVTDLESARLLEEIDRENPGTFLPHDSAVLLLSRFEIHQYPIDGAGRESARSGSTISLFDLRCWPILGRDGTNRLQAMRNRKASTSRRPGQLC